MATRIAAATGNWNTAGTWQTTIGTGTTNAENTAGTATINITTTANLDTPTFISAAATTVDAILIQIASINVATGTLAVILHNATDNQEELTVTIDASALPVNGGWVLCKFAATKLLENPDTYRLRLRRSTAVGIISVIGTSATNINRAFRVTTTGAPAAADRIFIGGQFTGASDITAVTVTMNLNAATDHGKIDISKSGTLTWTTGAATQLVTSGALDVWDGGTMNMGTAGVPITSTAAIHIDAAADTNLFGIDIHEGGTWMAQGASKSFDRTVLTADAAAGATSLTVADSTGWASGDVIALAGTTRLDTPGQTEAKALSGPASGTTLPINALGNPHCGTLPIRAELANLSRNVVIRSNALGSPVGNPPTIAAGRYFLRARATATVDLDWIEIRDFSPLASPAPPGFQVETTTGTFSMNRCSLHSAFQSGILIVGTTTNNITITNNVFFNLGAGGGNAGFYTNGPTTGSSLNYSGNLFLNRSSTVPSVWLQDLACNFNNNVIVGGSFGLRLDEATDAPTAQSGITVHNAASTGLLVVRGCSNLSMTNLKVYRCGATGGVGIAYGPRGTPFAGGGFAGHTYEAPEVFGNDINWHFDNNYVCNNFQINNGNFHGSGQHFGGDAAAPSSMGMTFEGHARSDFYLTNCNFGTSATLKTAHGSRDIDLPEATFLQMVCRVCSFANPDQAANPARVGGQTNLIHGSYIQSQREDNTVQRHLTRFSRGSTLYTSSTFHTDPPAEELRPTTNSAAATRFESGRRKITVVSGQKVLPKVWIYKDSQYQTRVDAAAAGQPRLVLKANIPLGVTVDKVVAIATAGGNAWQELIAETTGSPPDTVPTATDDGVYEFVVDCYSTNGTGSVFIDDWSTA